MNSMRKIASFLLTMMLVTLGTIVILMISTKAERNWKEKSGHVDEVYAANQLEIEENETEVIALELKPDSPLGKDVYPQKDYIYLSDYACLAFERDGNLYRAKPVKRTIDKEPENIKFYVDEECTEELGFNPILLSPQVQFFLAENVYVVLAEGERVLYFPAGNDIPCIIPIW